MMARAQEGVVNSLWLPKTSSGVTECDSYASGGRNVCVPDQAPARRTIPIEITGEARTFTPATERISLPHWPGRTFLKEREASL
jgi:hypothetical protein